jgi:hypothetical protein
MIRRSTHLAVLLGVGLPAACTSSTVTQDGGTDAAVTPEGGADAGATDGASEASADGPGGGPLGFTPSNVDLSGLDLSKAGDVTLSGSNCFIQPASQNPGWSCADATKFVMKTMTLPDQTKMVIYVVKSLRIEQSTLLIVEFGLGGGGDLPFAIVALDTMELLGSIKLSPGTSGGGLNAQSGSTGIGPGGGKSGPSSQLAGAGGGSFCGVGGAGSVEPGGTAFAKSSAYGTPALVPLVGGSAGGTGATPADGAGGGAIQLVAGTSIDLKAGAFISAPGQFGDQGGLVGTQEGNGGGSGGAILLEAPTVTIAGALAANGGGGGSGAGGAAAGGKSGDTGHDTDGTPALGGAPAASDHGGNGGAGDTADGTDGVSSQGASASGGGGGVGRIRINTMTGQAVLTGATVTPSASTTCFTQGMLK